LLEPALSARFSVLAASADGGSPYFVSTLRLKAIAQSLKGKVFLATGDEVRRNRSWAGIP